jgi:hypothetical protein
MPTPPVSSAIIRARQSRGIRERWHAESRAAIAAMTRKLEQHTAAVETMRPAQVAHAGFDRANDPADLIQFSRHAHTLLVWKHFLTQARPNRRSDRRRRSPWSRYKILLFRSCSQRGFLIGRTKQRRLSLQNDRQARSPSATALGSKKVCGERRAQFCKARMHAMKCRMKASLSNRRAPREPPTMRKLPEFPALKIFVEKRRKSSRQRRGAGALALILRVTGARPRDRAPDSRGIY